MNPPETKKFEILIGGKSPDERAAQAPAVDLIEAEKQLLIHANNQEFLFKWKNCTYRPENKEEYEVRACCGSTTRKTGWRCHHLSILDLNPQICKNCQSFKQKGSPAENI